MRILFVAAEMAPFAKVGGLADVIQGLPRALRALGHDARVIIPGHRTALAQAALAPAADPAGAAGDQAIEVPDPLGPQQARLIPLEAPGGVPTMLVTGERYFERESVYGYPDDGLRYAFLCRAALQVIRSSNWRPDIVHVHDWHTAPLTFALRNAAWHDPVFRSLASVITIHNLRYRGPDDFTDALGPGLYYADRITSVSPSYVREILEPGRGEGLEGILWLRRDHIRGIVNGLDTELWDPASDGALAATYTEEGLAARARNSAALAAEVGLSPGPLAAMVTRLTEQKGVDAVLEAIPAMVARGWRLLVLGSGDRALERGLTEAAKTHPGLVAHMPGFNDPLGRRIYGGADVLLMPSRFEPCGIGQLIAMRYGCVPVAHRTGGLADTIDDSGDHPTGFLFDDYSAAGLLGALDRAAAVMTERLRWQSIQRNGMTRDWSWSRPAAEYVAVYEAALGR